MPERELSQIEATRCDLAAERPIIVHCMALLIQHRTACDDDEAIDAAWAIFRYLGEPDKLPVTGPAGLGGRRP